MRKRNAMLRADSGMISAYRPARYVKRPSLIQRWARVAERFVSRWTGETTEQGAAGAVSPSTYAATLLQQRYERRLVIEECALLYRDEARCRRSVKRMASEAVKGGVRITIAETVPARLRKRAQARCDAVQAIVEKPLKSWARMLLVEGDLFIQAVVTSSGDLQAAKRMPGASMERLTDDADEFVDSSRAFAQVDIATNEEIANWPAALMFHERWDHEDGERYGNPEIAAARRLGNLLRLAEEAQNVRRMTRAPLTRLWSIGSPDNPAQTWDDVSKFKEENGFIEGKREIFDPTEVARDVFGNGLVTAETLEGDPHVHEVDDIRYQQNVYVNAALPTPGHLFGIDTESVNRDVMDDLRAEWLKSVDDLKEAIERTIRFLVNLALQLDGIVPEATPYVVTFAKSSLESEKDEADRIGALRDRKLLSRRKAVTLLSAQTGVEDVDAELAELDAETNAEMAREQRHALAAKNENGRDPESRAESGR